MMLSLISSKISISSSFDFYLIFKKSIFFNMLPPLVVEYMPQNNSSVNFLANNLALYITKFHHNPKGKN